MILANKYQTQLREVIEVENVTDKLRVEQLKKQGWKEVIDCERPKIEDEYHKIESQVNENENGDYYMTYSVVALPEKIHREIERFKQQLTNTDYKVVKNMEALQCGLELPYEPNALHNERQAIRDKINELEELLK